MEEIQKIFESVRDGSIPDTKANVQAALDAGIDPDVILKKGLISAMDEVGDLFARGDYYVPEMLLAARAMQQGLNILKPHLVQDDVETKWKVVMGTVKGDLHDIGKNLVAMMLRGAGFEVIDLGTDSTPERFLKAIREYNPHMIGMSALLTTTMPNMKLVVKMLEKEGLREQIKVMVGGAPVTEEFARAVGADGFARDAGVAVRVAKGLVGAS